MLYSSKITRVRFNLSGTEAAHKDAYVSVLFTDLFKNNQPFPQGIYDGHLGTTDHAYRCQTCDNNKRNCIGHEGSIPLKYPVWNPMAITEGLKWLKLICFKCGKSTVDPAFYIKVARNKRLDIAKKEASKGFRKCFYCKTPHPSVKKDPIEPLLFIAEYYDDNKNKIQMAPGEGYIYPHMAALIFNKIEDKTVIDLGKSPSSHPRNFILFEIKAPSVVIRPDVKKIGGGKSTNDPLTMMLQFIIKKNAALSASVPNTIDKKYAKSIFELNNSYYDFVKAGGENNMNSLALRLKGKQGRFRKNQMGKRSRNMCRGTITGDPTLKIDEVGVPILFARTIQYQETVQEYNKKILLTYVQNGRKKYPGATKIIKKNSGNEYDVDSAREIEIENGDIILRDMIDGDPVNFGRQPSLTISNISCMRAVITRDPRIQTLRMNVIACSLFNADFDGDAMLLSINAAVDSRNEISELASATNWVISHTTSSPTMGQVDDSIIGSAELTRSGVKLNKYHAMLLFSNNAYLPSFADIGSEGITGRDCISKILEDTPINFTRVPEWYKSNNTPWIDYDPSEIRVIIDQGKLVQGILDKKSIGKGANGGVYHLIANEYGNRRALSVMHDMQQSAIEFVKHYGYTIGIMDLKLSTGAKAKIDNIASDIINKSKLITERLNNGEIIPPIGKTVEIFFEEQQINTLSIFDDFTEPILEDINPNTNNLFKLINMGSKGKMENMFNMVSSIGQKQINGERIRQKFGYKRTLAYFPRFDTSPEARGYITNSYLVGMTSSEYVFNAMAARFDLISKALSTSVTGEQNRKSIKNLESILINNFRWAVKDKNIIQIAYGEDYLDPTKVVKVRFPTVMISDEAFRTKYRHQSFEAEFIIMQNDRELYRKLFKQIEHMNTKELMTDERRMPVDVESILNDFVREYSEDVLTTEPNASDIKLMVASITNLCNVIPYVLINNIQEKLKTKIPPHMQAASWLLTMLIRSYLHPNELIKRKMNPMVLDHIVAKIRLKYLQALIEPGTAVGIIAAQSFSEPLTQYMLDAHHRSASGGTSKTGMKQAKEVLGVKPLAKLTNPSMLIPVSSEFSSDRNKVQEIANNIEVMTVSQFTILWQIFFEKFGEPVHTDYVHEKSFIEQFLLRNPLLKQLLKSGQLVNWCIRIVLNKTMLILKNMSVDLIVTKLRELFPNIFIVYTPENSAQVILRIYVNSRHFTSAVDVSKMTKLKTEILDTIIRGVKGITNANVVKMIRTKLNNDGSISRNDQIWGIITSGTNLSGVLKLKYVDRLNVHTDAIQEEYEQFGIEAARSKIISLLRDLVDVCNYRHYMEYGDEMSYTGKPTSIESGGLKTRESSNILLRIGFVSPLKTMEEAAINSMEDAVTGVTAPLLVGSIPRHGTLYNSFHINSEFIRKNVPNPEALINEGLF
jgi:DNA-directed RNA polymerase II subunit RPB1